MSKQGKNKPVRSRKQKLLTTMLTSIMGMILCTSMLLGTTMAWFTDTVHVTGNQINTGSLKVDLLYGSKLLKNTSEPIFGGDVTWKPAHMEVRNLSIVNTGTLNIRYVLNLILETDDKNTDPSIAKYFDVFVKEDGHYNYGEIADYKDKILNHKDGWVEIDELSDIFTSGRSILAGYLNYDPSDSVEQKNFAIAIRMKQLSDDSTQGKSMKLGIKLDAYQEDIPDSEIGGYKDLVSTSEGLQEALAAAAQANAGDSVIKLGADINMTGKTWTPINVDGYRGAEIITIDGNGHKITGLTAPLFAGGFAGDSGIVIKNLTIENSNIVSSNTQGSGAFIECIDSMGTITLENCHLKNSTVSGSRTGGLIGWTSGYNNQNDGPVKTYVTVKDCSVVGCTLNATSSLGGIMGHSGANPWTYTTIKDCKVENNTLKSTNTSDWRVGVVVGTVNVGEQNDISGITSSGNTLTQTGMTAPAGQSDLYGRFVPGETGKLTINGTQIGN